MHSVTEQTLLLPEDCYQSWQLGRRKWKRVEHCLFNSL